MAELKKKIGSKNTLQEVLEQEKAKIPSKYDFNKVRFTWEANDRPIYAVSGQQKSGFTGLVVLIGLYFLWVGQPLLTLFAAAVFFVMFTMISVPPERIKHNIESVGIRTNGALYVWEDMKRYWMAEKNGVIVLYIDTRLNFPPRLIFMIESFQEATKIAILLSEKLEYRFLTSEQSGMDKMLEGKYIDPTIFSEQDQREKELAEERKND